MVHWERWRRCRQVRGYVWRYVCQLADAKVDVNLRCPRGESSLHPMACEGSNEEIIMRVRVEILWYRSREETQLRHRLCKRVFHARHVSQFDMTQLDLRPTVDSRRAESNWEFRKREREGREIWQNYKYDKRNSNFFLSKPSLQCESRKARGYLIVW